VPTLRDLRRILIVEDHAPLRAALAGMLRAEFDTVVEASTWHGALALLDPPPDLLICDIWLPDGSALKLLQKTLDLSPEPLKIAMSGNASASEAFLLGQLGVSEYLAKPFQLDDMRGAIRRVATESPPVDPLLRASVGKVPMRELQERVRSVMVDQALGLSSGSRSGAARLLNVSRQAVQQMIRSRSGA